MAYNDTPLPTETPSASQNLLRQNFNQIAISYNTDHVALTSALNIGQHKQVTLANVLASDPNQVAPVSSVYTKTASGAPNLFFQNGVLATNVIQMTRQGLSSAAGQGFIPGGLQIRAGQNGFSGASIDRAISFGANPYPNGFISAVAIIDSATPILLQIRFAGLGGFTVTKQSAAGTESFYWISVGY